MSWLPAGAEGQLYAETGHGRAYENQGVASMFTKEMATETYEVGSFDKLVLRDDSGGGVVYIEQGLTEGLQVEADRELLRRIVVEVQNRTLFVRLGGSWLERLGDKLTTSLTRPKIIYRLQVRELKSVDLRCAEAVQIPSLKTDELRMNLCGATQADVDMLKADLLVLQHSGMGRLRFEGSVQKQDVQLSGAGTYSALALQSEQAVISLSGSAQAHVYATASLDATIRGMGTVEYRGDPRVRQQIFGMGSVIHVA